MENKKTSELLDLLTSLVDEDGGLKEGWEEVRDELWKRSPFDQIFPAYDDGESLEEKIEWLETEVKKLKRHSHKEGMGEDRVVIAI